MPRTVLKILCIVSGLLFLVLGISLIVSIAVNPGSAGTAGSIGIIGGADAPTVEFLVRKALRSPACCIAMVSFFVFIATGLGLIFGKE